MLTEKQAFDAMPAFLNAYADGLDSVELLRLVQYLYYEDVRDEGEPVTGSPFAWGEWLEAVESVTSGHGAA